MCRRGSSLSKSARAEAAYISDYVSRMLMARPQIAFKLIQNGKTVYQSAGEGSLRDAVYCVYGGDVFPHLRELFYDDGYVRLSGFIGTEQAARSNRNAQSFYINARYIKSQKLSFALQRAYDMRLMVSRFPFAVLNIVISPNEIDVNVHPNKLDVRFKNEERILRAATIAARQALGDPVALPNRSRQCRCRNSGKRLTGTHLCDKTRNRTSWLMRRVRNNPCGKLRPPKWKRPSELFRPAEATRPPILREPVAMSARPLPDPFPRQEPHVQGNVPVPIPAQIPALVPPEKPVAPKREEQQTRLVCNAYRIIGQAFDCYWIVQQDDNVFFIDQHAAHERRLYERFAEKGVAAQSQILLVPTVLKLSPFEFSTLMDNLPQFEELGFEIEEFGMLTVSVRAVPHLIGQPQTAEFLREAIALLDKRNRLSTVELKRAALIQAACKHAVKAGEVLNRVEIEALLREYEAEGAPLTCPHGRPVMVKMTKLDFEKLFKRVL